MRRLFGFTLTVMVQMYMKNSFKKSLKVSDAKAKARANR